MIVGALPDGNAGHSAAGSRIGEPGLTLRANWGRGAASCGRDSGDRETRGTVLVRVRVGVRDRVRVRVRVRDRVRDRIRV